MTTEPTTVDHARAERRLSRVVLLLMVTILVPLQFVLTWYTEDMGVDGGYYLDVAMNVRDGLGLVSDVSLYHSGFPSFPHPTPIYPLWPWLLGQVGRVVDIMVAAHWLPFAFWLVTLGGAWFFGKGLVRRGLFGLPWLNGGHLMVMAVASQRELSRFSAQPYTEAVSYAVLFVALARLVRMKGSVRDGLELGLWLSLACICRSQFFVLPMAVACGLGVVGLFGGREGRRWLLPGGIALGAVLLTLGIWLLDIRSFMPDAPALVLLRFDQAQVSDVLEPIDVIKNTDGLAEFVTDRLGGVLIAYDWTSWRRSYGRGFHLLQWALPLAGLASLLLLPRRPWRGLRAWLVGPQGFAVVVLVFLSLGALASIHLPHKDGFDDWYFHRRHAAVNLVPFGLCLLFLGRFPGRRVRLMALVFTLAHIGTWAESEYYQLSEAIDDQPTKMEPALAEWLDDRSSAEDPLVVAMWAFKPPEIAWRTDHVGYHWFYERTSHEDLVKMFDELGADVLIFREKRTRTWRFRSYAPHFAQAWERIPYGPRGLLAYKRRGAPSPFEVPEELRIRSGESGSRARELLLAPR